jgi:site-specific recombinase XerD
MEIQQIYNQLNPNNQLLARQLIMQMAQQQGIKVNMANKQKPPMKNLDLWIASLKGESKSPNTIKLYVNAARNILTHMPEPTELALQEYFAKRLEAVTPSRIANEQKAMKSLFKFLHKHGLYNGNPAADITTMRSRTAEVECPTNETIMALMRYNTRREKDRPRYRLMLFLLIQTGLRIEEACSIRRTWINIPACEVRVIGKGNKERTVPIGNTVTQLLKDFMELVEPVDSQWLFPGETVSGYWNHSGFRGALRLACKKLGLKPIHPHQLRHYFATRTLENGAKLEVISKILGHANVSITAEIYRHIQQKEYHDEHTKHNPLAQLPGANLLALPGGVVEGEFEEVKEPDERKADEPNGN